MRRAAGKTLFTASLLAFAAIFLWLTLGLGRVARLVPLAVIIPTMGLLIIQLVLDLVPRLADGYRRLEKKDLFRVEKLRTEQARGVAAAADVPAELERRAFFWLTGMVVSLYLFGFLVAIPLYTLLYLRLRSREGWFMSSVIAAAMCGLLFFVVDVSMKIRLYEGRIWSLLGL